MERISIDCTAMNAGHGKAAGPARATARASARALVPAVALALALALAAGPAPAAVEPSGDAAGFYEDALERYRDGDFDGAVIQLKNALQRDPKHLPARILLGRSHLQAGDPAAAEQELLLAIGAGADRALVDPVLARAYFQQREFGELLGRIELADHPLDVQAEILVVRGQAQVELGRLEQAEASFLEADALAPDDVAPLLGRAAVHLRRRELAAAGALIDEALGREPDSAEAWYMRGEVRRYAGDLEGAIEAYGEAVSRLPLHMPARNARAAARIDLGRHAAAAEDLEAVREHFPFEPQAAYLHSLALRELGKEEEAEQALRVAAAAIATIPADALAAHPPSLLLAAVIAHLRGNREQAFRHLESYVTRYPNHAGARKRLGSLLIGRREYNRAVEVLEPALRLAPNDAGVYGLLGTAHLRVGDHASATSMLRRAVELAPDIPHLRIRLAESRLARGRDQDAAMADLAVAFEMDDSSVRAGMLLGMLHLARREFDTAVRVAREVLDREPGHLPALNLLGSALIGRGDHARAREVLEQALELDPRFRPAELNLATLAVREGDIDAARARYEAILARDPNETQAMSELARIAMTQGRREDALRWLEKLRAVDPDAVQEIAQLVDLYLEGGEVEAARGVAGELESRHPENLQVLDAVARTQQAGGLADQARATYRRMVTLASYGARWLHRIAHRQIEVEDLDGARWTLGKAVQGEPGYLPAKADLARLEARLGNFTDAILLAREVRDAASDDPDADAVLGEVVLGDVLYSAGRPAEAAAAYAAAQREQPRGDVAIKRYRAQHAAGETRQAIEALETWVGSHPEDLLARRVLAVALVAAGRLDASRTHHEALLERFPDDPALLNNLALIYHRAGDPRALELARRAHEAAPERAEIIDTLGWLMVETGDPAGGLRLLREAHSRAATAAEIRYHIGVALARLGREEEARRELEEALAGGDDFDGADDARALLAELSE